MNNTNNAQPASEQDPPQSAIEEQPAEESTAQETVTTEEPAPPQKRSRRKIILIVLGVLLLIFILFAIATYFYLQRQGLTPDKLSPQPKPPATTIAPRDTKSNTYQNQNYKFSLPIPTDVKVKESPYGFGITSIEMRDSKTAEDEHPDIQMLLFPKGLAAAVGQDFNKFHAAPNNTTEEISVPTGESVLFTKVRNRTVNNLRAFEFISSSNPPDPNIQKEIGVYIEIGTDVLILSTGELNRAKLEEMLIDFKYPL